MLTPQEVSEKVFPKSSGFGSGYAMGAVDEFLDALTEDYTALFKENVTLLTAQKMAAKLVQEAQTEKDNMLKEAREQHAAQLAQLEKDKQEAEDKLVMAKQSLVDFVRHGSELCAQQQEFLNSLPEMQLSAEESPAASPVADIQQDIMHHMDAMETAAAEPEEPAVKDVLKFGRNYTGE